MKRENVSLSTKKITYQLVEICRYRGAPLEESGLDLELECVFGYVLHGFPGKIRFTHIY
jgi:hypothetical protein